MADYKTSDRKKIVLIYGGQSGEHEISLISAAAVLTHLDPDKYEITPVGIDKTGLIFVNDYDELLQYPQSLPVQTDQSRSLPALIANGRLALEADLVFPVVHGPLYEDGCLQGLFELVNVAYVGSGVLASAVCMDKDMTRRVLGKDLVQSATYIAIPATADAAQRKQLYGPLIAANGFPLFVKPATLGSSVAIDKVHTVAALEQALDTALRYDTTALVEAYIDGREIELAVLENPDPNQPPLVSIAGEIVVGHPDGFYSYAAKYLEPNQSTLIMPAPLPEQTLSQLQALAQTIFTRLKCHGLARIDFFVHRQTGEIYFNEINTLPGFTPVSMYPKLWQSTGLSYPHLLDKLIALGFARQKRQALLIKSYQ